MFFPIYNKIQGFIDESGLFIYFFSRLTQKFKMAAKRGRKKIFCEKLPVDSAETLQVKHFCRHRSISLRFRDKRIFVFNTDIQDGRQKWRENIFLRNNASRFCRYPVGQKFCGNHSILLCFRHKYIFAFYTEIQDGRQKWWENNLRKVTSRLCI